MAHPAPCIHHQWWHSPDPPNELTSSSINPRAGPSSHLGPAGPSGDPVTSLGWCRRSRWQASQVAGSGDPRRRTLEKGRPPNLSTAPHGGWSRAPRRPSCLGTSLNWGFPAPIWGYTVNWYTVTVTILGMSWKTRLQTEDFCSNYHTRTSVSCWEVCCCGLIYCSVKCVTVAVFFLLEGNFFWRDSFPLRDDFTLNKSQWYQPKSGQVKPRELARKKIQTPKKEDTVNLFFYFKKTTADTH